MTALAPPTTRRDRPRSSAATPGLRPLALIEARRLLTRPAVLIGAALSLLLMVHGTWSSAPVLNREDATASGALLVLAAATLLAANSAVLRSRRYATDELLGVVPTVPALRTMAALVATVGPAALAGVCVGGFLLWRLAGDPVTSPDPFEMLTGPVLVLLGGCAGVALGRWLPSVTVAPIAVVGLAALEFGLNLLITGTESGGRTKWLAPFVGQQAVARELLVRPTGWHLLYVAALVALVACLALLRHAPTRTVGMAAAVATAVAVTSAGVQLRPLMPEQQPAALAARISRVAQQNCQQHATVTYCALPAYEPWIEDWRATIDSVMTAVPASTRPRMLVVRQDISGSDVEYLGETEPAVDAPTTTEVRPGLWWGSSADDGPYRFGLALGVAALVVGLSPDGAVLADGEPSVCSVVGQGRAVVALWLAAQADSDAADYLHDELAALRGDRSRMPSPEIYFDGNYGQPVSALAFGRREAVAALQLIDRPRAEVSTMIASHWDELTNPATSTARAQTVLGLPEPTAARNLDGGTTVDLETPQCR